MTLEQMIATTAILLLVALGNMIALWILAVRKAYRLETLLEEILNAHGMTGFEIRAILDGDATLTIDGGTR